MPKLEVRMFDESPSNPPNYKQANKKSDFRSIPVSENRRATCDSIKFSVMGRIEAQIEAERNKAETLRINAENAAKPFREFKEKLANPRIKRSP